VLVHEVEEREFVSLVEAIGTVRAVESADLSSSLTQVVSELLFDDGDVVEQGQLLARLRSEEEEASLVAARAVYEEELREVGRLTQLAVDRAVPEVRLQERQTQLEVARARVLEAQSRLAELEIRAPFPGVLGLRRVSVGALVSPGAVLAKIDRIDRVFIDFTVAEAFLAELRPGLELESRNAAWPDQLFLAEVIALDSRVDPVTRAVEVRAVVDNEGGKLRPGMLMTTRLKRAPRDSPALPERALVPLGERAFVFVVAEGEEGGKVVERRAVEVGERVPGWVEVADGLEAGEVVVTDGVIGLSGGSGVSVVGEYEGPAEAFDPRSGR
jgi:membrane fusion protein, multidrug efflux system